jgi:hypothetical protein
MILLIVLTNYQIVKIINVSVIIHQFSLVRINHLIVLVNVLVRFVIQSRSNVRIQRFYVKITANV